MIPVDDLVSVLDLLAIDQEAENDFGGSPLLDKMRVAVEDWLEPRLAANGWPVVRFLTRRPPSKAWAYTGGAYSDLPSSVALPLVLANPTNDAVFVGLGQPFRGLFCAIVDSVNANSCTATLAYWNGSWNTFGSSIVNTTAIGPVPFARGGRIQWPMPTDWVQREVEGERAYWMRLQINSPIAGGPVIEQLLPITRSRLTHAVAQRALGTLYAEGAASSRGEWKEKATSAFDAAQAHLDLVMNQIGD